jgi:hypothetical protein
MSYPYAQNSLLPIREGVVQAALRFAHAKYGMPLDEGRLRFLYDKTRARRAHEKCSFNEAKHWALRQVLTEHDCNAQRRFKAYSAAIGKMGNLNRQIQDREAHPPKKRTATQRIMDRVTLGRDGKQYEFILS